MCQKKKKSHSAAHRSYRFHGTRLCSQGSISLKLWTKIADSWTALLSWATSSFKHQESSCLSAKCSSTKLWLQESLDRQVIRTVFCPAAAPEGCGEQSCVSGDLLRQPAPRAREPLRAAGDSDEPAGQDQVSASCRNHQYDSNMTNSTSNFSNRKKGKNTHT